MLSSALWYELGDDYTVGPQVRSPLGDVCGDLQSRGRLELVVIIRARSGEPVRGLGLELGLDLFVQEMFTTFAVGVFVETDDP